MASTTKTDSALYFKRLGLPIVAIATAAGGPVGVLRISGKNLKFLEKLVGDLPAPGQFSYRSVKIQNSGKLLEVDRALVLNFQGPHSFTGEDVVEIQLHGVPAVLQAVQSEIEANGAFLALPGEFSFRAVMNEKMDLAEAEGIQSAFAVEGLGLEWAEKLLGLRKSGAAGSANKLAQVIKALEKLRGRVEAAIDFPEAEAEQSAEIEGAKILAEQARRELAQLLSNFEVFRRQSSEPSIAVVGEANSGKSTLVNILCGGQRSLVSPIAGTTRDTVEVRIRLRSGNWARVLDTAGLRENAASTDHDKLEIEGMELGLERARDAHFLIWVKRADRITDPMVTKTLGSVLRPKIEVFSHNDLLSGMTNSLELDNSPAFDFLKEGDRLAHYLLDQIDTLVRTGGDLADGTKNQDLETPLSQRQALLLEYCDQELSLAEESLKELRPIELACEHIRQAEAGLKRAIGRGQDEAYIGEIFSQFCLGK